jgi:hypothetical protein
MSFITYNGKWINQFEQFGSSVAGTTVETIIGEVTIPANTYKATDLIMLTSMYGKTGTAGIWTQRYYWVSGPSATLSGALQISVRGMVAANQFANQERRLYIRTANGTGTGITLGTEVISSSTSALNDYVPSTSSNLAIDWTIEGTIFTTITLGSASDSVSCEYLKIWEW